jgi:imidazolonepropionase-like amidohydrolase
MGMGDELGRIKEGFIADLLLIDGDPLKDLNLVVHEKSILVIMKEGSLHKDVSAASTRESTIEAD